eukprot:Tbor_TRINITY_DN5642_c4_g1::TRINITY_DN5642_c4_g1_i3::g.9595::m.9595
MAHAAYVGTAQLHLFEPTTAQYTEYGTLGVAIMGSSDGIYKLGCYNTKNEYVCTAPITANNEASAKLALQGQGYVSFKDDQGRSWSMLFASEADAVEFGAHFAVAMYGAAFQPESNIIACDVSQGKKERLLFADDKVKVRFTSWVVQRGNPGQTIAKLGSKLESNEHDDKPYAFTVPANHLSVKSDMKGFEGMVIGVGEEGMRYLVIPQSAKRGSGPNAHMCFFVNVLRKKDENKDLRREEGGAISGYSENPQYRGALTLGYDHHGYDARYHSQAVTVVEQPPVVIESPQVPPGFNAEQLQIVDRMRDQIQALTLQLKDATGKLDMFRNDYGHQQAKEKPKSLGSMQLEHSLQKMIQDTDDMKEELHQRDGMLRQVEEKNRELQKKVDRFSATANQLADEKKAAINSGSEEKVDLDRRIAQLQGQVTRIQGEREDVARHMSTVKRLLEVSDQDMKTEKNKLQVAIVQFQTNESKLVTLEEALSEERARKKVLESKVMALGEELRSINEDLRIKEGQIEERKRKIEADKLHYTQVIDEERSKAAEELRELRQELIDEIAIRDRRYAEEKQRVSQESAERGRIQGIEDGTNETLLEADGKIQDYVLTVQRCKSEMETMKIRVRQVKEQADADQRRIQAQIQTLTTVLDDLYAANSSADLEIESLKTRKISVEEDTFDKMCHTLRGLGRPIGKRDLVSILHDLRMNKDVDLSFETDREREEIDNIERERNEVIKWVRLSLSPGAASYGVIPMPAIRPKNEERMHVPTQQPTVIQTIETVTDFPVQAPFTEVTVTPHPTLERQPQELPLDENTDTTTPETTAQSQEPTCEELPQSHEYLPSHLPDVTDFPVQAPFTEVTVTPHPTLERQPQELTLDENTAPHETTAQSQEPTCEELPQSHEYLPPSYLSDTPADASSTNICQVPCEDYEDPNLKAPSSHYDVNSLETFEKNKENTYDEVISIEQHDKVIHNENDENNNSYHNSEVIRVEEEDENKQENHEGQTYIHTDKSHTRSLPNLSDSDDNESSVPVATSTAPTVPPDSVKPVVSRLDDSDSDDIDLKPKAPKKIAPKKSMTKKMPTKSLFDETDSD